MKNHKEYNISENPTAPFPVLDGARYSKSWKSKGLLLFNSLRLSSLIQYQFPTRWMHIHIILILCKSSPIIIMKEKYLQKTYNEGEVLASPMKALLHLRNARWHWLVWGSTQILWSIGDWVMLIFVSHLGLSYRGLLIVSRIFTLWLTHMCPLNREKK